MTLLVFLSSASMADPRPVVKIAIQPTFGAHQQIGYEIIRRLPENAKKHGINDLQIETVKTKSSIDGNMFLLNGQVDINVGSISSFLILHSKSPGSAKLLAAVGHYRYFLLCQPEIKKIEDDLVQKGGERFRGATGSISNLVSSSYEDYKKYGLGIGDGAKMKPKAQITNTKVDMGGTVTFKIDAGTNVNTRDLENYINSNEFKKKFFDTLLQMDSNTRTNLRRNLGIS